MSQACLDNLAPGAVLPFDGGGAQDLGPSEVAFPHEAVRGEPSCVTFTRVSGAQQAEQLGEA